MKVGDYVRTKCFGIKKINGFCSTLEEDFIGCDYDKYQTVLINKKDVIKSSPNILELLRVGDYVNGLKVSRVGETYHGRKDKAIYCDYCVDKETGKWTMIYEEDIKSIVTKEQFKSMEYRIGE